MALRQKPGIQAYVEYYAVSSLLIYKFIVISFIAIR